MEADAIRDRTSASSPRLGVKPRLDKCAAQVQLAALRPTPAAIADSTDSTQISRTVINAYPFAQDPNPKLRIIKPAREFER